MLRSANITALKRTDRKFARRIVRVYDSSPFVEKSAIPFAPFQTKIFIETCTLHFALAPTFYALKFHSLRLAYTLTKAYTHARIRVHASPTRVDATKLSSVNLMLVERLHADKRGLLYAYGRYCYRFPMDVHK